AKDRARGHRLEVEIESAGFIPILFQIRRNECDWFTRYNIVEHNRGVISQQHVGSRNEVVYIRIEGSINDTSRETILFRKYRIRVTTIQNHIVIAKRRCRPIKIKEVHATISSIHILQIVAPSGGIEDH